MLDMKSFLSPMSIPQEWPNISFESAYALSYFIKRSDRSYANRRLPIVTEAPEVFICVPFHEGMLPRPSAKTSLGGHGSSKGARHALQCSVGATPFF